MKKKLLFLIFFIVLPFAIHAQVGIGVEDPHASAALEIVSKEKGFLISRMTLEEKNAIHNPAESLLIYQTDGEVGFYYFDGSFWVYLNSIKQINADWNSTSGVSEILNKPSISKAGISGDFNDLENIPAFVLVSDTSKMLLPYLTVDKIQTFLDGKASVADLNKEIARAIIAEEKLAKDLQAEVTRATLTESVLQVNIENVKEKLENQIKTNADKISTNTTGINSLNIAVNQNATSINTLDTKVSMNTTDVQSNANNILSNAGDIAILKSTVSQNSSVITSNATSIQTNATDIALKENSSNKSTDGTLSDETDTKFPTEKAVKTFVEGKVSTLNTASTNIQTELDATQFGSGLTNDGTYVANAATNYINTASSLKDATEKLDGQAKTNADNIATNKTGITGLNTQVSTNSSDIQTIETTIEDNISKITGLISRVGLTESDIETIETTVANNITEVSGLVTQVGANQSNIENIQTAIGTINTAIPTLTTSIAQKENTLNKSTDGTFTNENDIKFPTVKAVKTYVDGKVTAINSTTEAFQTELNATQTGAGLQTNGSYVANTTSNYLSTASSLKDADEKLDIQAKANAEAISTINTLDVGRIYLGNLENKATEVAISGDITLNNSGVSAIGANKVNSAMILDETILTADIANNAVNTDKLDNLAVTAEKLAIAAVTGDKLANFSVTSDKLANAAVTADKLATLSVTTSKIADASITSSKILDGTITNAVISASAEISGTKINPNFGTQNIITSGKLTTGAITLPNLDGTTGQVLSTNGDGVVTWITPSSASSSDFVDLTSDQTVGGVKSFENDILVNGQNIGSGASNDNSNIAFGNGALEKNVYGQNNTALGALALTNNTDGDMNTAVGNGAMYYNTTGIQNTATGRYALFSNTEGIYNTSLGFGAGSSIEGSNNTMVGANTNGTATTENSTALGYGAIVSTDNTIQLGNTSVTDVKTSGTLTANAFVGDGSQLTNLPSSGGLVSIIEGENTGYRRADANAANYGDIGNGAVDLSISDYSNSQNGATGYASVAMGELTIASGANSTAMGNITEASGDGSTAMGTATGASGIRSTAMGFSTFASGPYSTAMGRQGRATGENSTAMGSATTASGTNSIAMGFFTRASDYGSLVLGQFNSRGSTATSATAFSANAPALVIGNGTGSSAKSDAFVVDFSGNVTSSGTLTAGAITLPNTDGSSGQLLSTNGLGTVTWTSSLADGTTATTQAANDNSNKIATTAYVDQKVTSGSVLDMEIQSLDGAMVEGVKTIFLSNQISNNVELLTLNGGVKGQEINLVFAPSNFESYMTLIINPGGNMGIFPGVSFSTGMTGGIVLIFDGQYWRVMNRPNNSF
ncbi:hypothetical protein [Belliella aquatica]|uniref:Trimeric autotransporter adhesin YadA-like head domain-containing protein n=1 Tax=Belliella aquatica TaxID=1323734 RepID=A0ABQ1N4B1_9BACT|nr:hypothetical protein [Belliella aquatica]MCH7407370.1 hypothetical protein [Belliella aquatica]GGC52885.1 hypothetical protein GCM10010993_34150 [Belliella aquatica]